MQAVVGSFDIATDEVRFFFVEVEKLDGEPAIDVEGELTKVSAINDDGYGFEIVQVLGEAEAPDKDLADELAGILKRRFEFLH